jgi:glycosyltransferase involved in cell wall biosynthesis
MLAPLSAPGRRTRLSKMIPVLRDAGYQVRFFGWERVRGEMEQFAWNGDGVDETAILHGGGNATRRARLMYPLWMLAVFWRVLTLGRAPMLFCLGWETAFPARVAAAFTGAQVVFDDADRFSLVVRLPRPLHQLLQMLERWTSRHVLLHLVPGFSRYDWRGANMLVLRNTPSQADFEAAARLTPPRDKADLVLYANGWLVDSRGTPIFLEALRRFDSSPLDIRLLIAGSIESDAGRALISHPKVTYMGELPQREALALYPFSDLVLTYYDPDVPINRLAESNKWGDCVYFGTPFLVNSEVETAAGLVAAGAAFAVPYHDVDALVALLSAFARDKAAITQASRACASLRADYPVFDAQLRRILQIVAAASSAAHS